jgi:hypothetical protein
LVSDIVWPPPTVVIALPDMQVGVAATARTEVDVNALKLRRQPLKEIELPTPEPTGTEILLEVTHCGVC